MAELSRKALAQIFRLGVKQFGARHTDLKPNPKAQTTGSALDKYAGTVERHLAAVRNQRRHPTAEFMHASAADLRRPPSAETPQRPAPPRSLADEAAAFRAGLRGETERFRDTALLGKPAPPPDVTKKAAQETDRAPKAAQPKSAAGLVQGRTTSGVPGRAPESKLPKATAAGLGHASTVSESRGQAGAEVNHTGPSVGRGIGLAKDATGLELKQSMEPK